MCVIAGLVSSDIEHLSVTNSINSLTTFTLFGSRRTEKKSGPLND